MHLRHYCRTKNAPRVVYQVQLVSELTSTSQATCAHEITLFGSAAVQRCSHFDGRCHVRGPTAYNVPETHLQQIWLTASYLIGLIPVAAREGGQTTWKKACSAMAEECLSSMA